MNWSFFGAKVIRPTTANDDTGASNLIKDNNSLKLIYMRNFHKGRTFINTYYDLGEEERNYSLNINALLPVTNWGGAPQRDHTDHLRS